MLAAHMVWLPQPHPPTCTQGALPPLQGEKWDFHLLSKIPKAGPISSDTVNIDVSIIHFIILFIS